MWSYYRIITGHVDSGALSVAVEGLHDGVRVGNTNEVEYGCRLHLGLVERKSLRVGKEAGRCWSLAISSTR
jgi:hypothetical protein